MSYDRDVLTDLSADPRHASRSKAVPVVTAELSMVVEEAGSGYCGAIVELSKQNVTLEDRHNRRRVFPLVKAGFLLEGQPVTLAYAPPKPTTGPRRTASGSIAVANAPAHVAKASRIYVEGIHDAALVERIWGEDLRIEGVVVEPLHGIDELPAIVTEFGPRPNRRLGVLVDHLVTGSKEHRLADANASAHVLITGHPYVDIWQAVKPAAVGIRAWPQVPRGTDWKQGICDGLGAKDPATMWRHVLGSVSSYADLETPLLNAMEQLIDFVTDPVEQ